MIKCFRKAVDSKFDDAYTRTTLFIFISFFISFLFILFMLAVGRC